MHHQIQESTASTGIDVPAVDISGLWLCPQCGDIHPTPSPCSSAKGASRKAEARLETDVRLCACCCRKVVAIRSRFSSFFCPDCGARVVEVNRSIGRLVVPVCRDPEANSALFPTAPDEPALSPGIECYTRFFGAQLELLKDASYCRTMILFRVLRLPEDKPVWLDTYLRCVATLREDVFQPPAALLCLVLTFGDYLLEVPSESPALAARVERKASAFARGIRAKVARRLLEKSPTELREVGRRWAWMVIDEVLPLPAYVDPSAPELRVRRSHTILALVEAAIRNFARVHGLPRRPPAIQAMPVRGAVSTTRPGESRLAGFPQACPRTARFVIGLEGTPAAREEPLSSYHLSMDRRHSWWILWSDGGDRTTGAPTAWCPRNGQTAVDAAFLLLHASLTRDLETHGKDRKRPGIAIAGLLDEDLANMLLDRLWPPE